MGGTCCKCESTWGLHLLRTSHAMHARCKTSAVVVGAGAARRVAVGAVVSVEDQMGKLNRFLKGACGGMGAGAIDGGFCMPAMKYNENSGGASP
jgi:hypothetical protein